MDKNKNQNFDVLIIGGGIAGLCCALELSQDKKLRICILSSAREVKFSNSFYAQGGIVYEEEHPEALSLDIQEASSHTASHKAIEFLSKNSYQAVQSLLLDKAKVPFGRDPSGNFLFTQEAAHSVPRIIYQGDYTGKAILVGLIQYLQEYAPNVEIKQEMTAIDLITPNHHGVDFQSRYENGRVWGVYALQQSTGEVQKILSKYTVLATGGVGALYLHNTNWKGARGDGQAMAKRAGAFLQNMEFIQFHPTTFYDRSGNRRFLISEAVRGEGGRLINARGEPFMLKYHAQGDLASRDVVSQAIWKEMIEGGQHCVYLDITQRSKDYLEKRFPTIYQYLSEKNIRMEKDTIPVVPAAHYSCGGILVDWRGRTNLSGLYAIGEVSCTGLHGANRLASTSLLEGVLWGKSSGEDILKRIGRVSHYNSDRIRDWEKGTKPCDPALVKQDFLSLKHTMWNYVGLTRSPKRLMRASAMLSELYNHVQQFYLNAQINDSLLGLRNALEVAQVIVKSSMRNKQSIGCFYLEDDE